MKNLKSMGFLLVLIMVLLSYSSAYSDDVIRIGGTGVALGTMRQLALEFEKKNPDIHIRFKRSIGSSGAITSVSKNGLDIGLLSRQLKPEELELSLNVIEYAKSPFVFISGARVPIRNINESELVELYQRKILTWPNGEPVRIVLRPIADSDNIVARRISPAMAAALDNLLYKEGMLVALTNQDAVDIVSKTPGTLGFSSLTQITTEVNAARVLKFNNVSPSLSALANGTYPLSHTLSFVTRKPASASVSKFIAFVFSPKGASILKKTGNLPSKKRLVND
jgi:phosphate transport system substrate-binding protein